MVDVLTRKQRSFNMSQIKSGDTGPENIFKKALCFAGIRNSIMHPRNILGKPDFYFPKQKLTVFIDGCFWHRCRECFQQPGTNRKFWLDKINENVKRDKKIDQGLKKKGFMVLRFWEHEIKKKPEKCLEKLKQKLSKKALNLKTLTVLDLFSGAGGLSEGFYRSRFDFVAHIEVDKDSCETLKTRALYYLLFKKGKTHEYYKYLKGTRSREELFLEYDKEKTIEDSIVNEEISETTLPRMKERIRKIMKRKKIKNIDVVIGGPPCQTYSLIGRARMKAGVRYDNRNNLYRIYLDFLKCFKPKVFLFENVPGMKTAANGKYFKDLKVRAKKLGYSARDYDLKAHEFGVPQLRKRIVLMGINLRKVKRTDFPEFRHSEGGFKVRDFLDDLPFIKPGNKKNVMDYKKSSTAHLARLGIRKKGFNILTDHITRRHCVRDLEIYSIAIKNLKFGKKIRYNELPSRLQTHKNTGSFLDRYRVIDPYAATAQTIVAHISKDGHYYIYPDLKQLRSLSVREAARLQTFPDDFKFEGSMTSKFRQIGNAVPPVLSRVIAKEIINCL